MASFTIQVRSRALPGQDSVYNKWYEETHMADVLSIDGFKSCSRFEIVDGKSDATTYIASYEAECEDPQELLGRLFEASKNMELTDSMDSSSVEFTILRPLSQRAG